MLISAAGRASTAKADRLRRAAKSANIFNQAVEILIMHAVESCERAYIPVIPYFINSEFYCKLHVAITVSLFFQGILQNATLQNETQVTISVMFLFRGKKHARSRTCELAT